ncbi:unnamed protein product, partial [Rotaria sp. Silwood2]
VVIWIVTPIIYYSNTWDSKKMPIILNRAFDINGDFYDSMKVLNKNLLLNETAYEIYGGVRMTAAYAVSYCFVFAAFSAYIVHTILYHGKFIVEQFRMTLSDKRNDIHAKLMSYYPEVSEWCSPLLPGYIMIIAIVINFIMMIPTGVIVAVTNMTLILAVPIEILSSFILPGNPIGFLTLRVYTQSCQYQIIHLLFSFKFAHYMKIPPRITFSMLLTSVIIASIVHYITAIYLLYNV